LTNTNESATIARIVKIYDLNKALVYALTVSSRPIEMRANKSYEWSQRAKGPYSCPLSLLSLVGMANSGG
jgi:hypothetical protein